MYILLGTWTHREKLPRPTTRAPLKLIDMGLSSTVLPGETLKEAHASCVGFRDSV